MSTFPVGARVYVDGRDEAIVLAAYPDGSSSYLHPHYKVDFVGGDRNVAVPLSRVGVARMPRLTKGQRNMLTDVVKDGYVHGPRGVRGTPRLESLGLIERDARGLYKPTALGVLMLGPDECVTPDTCGTCHVCQKPQPCTEHPKTA